MRFSIVSRWLTRIPQACTTLSLATLLSCAGSEPGVGSGGTGVTTGGVASGSITGFGSVFIEGVRYDESAASISIEIDPKSAQVANSSELKLGMHADLSFTPATSITEKSQKITVSAEVIGPVNQLATASAPLQVAGQAVVVSNTGVLATVLDGIASIADIKLGDELEVYGYRDANDQIRATRIELRDADQARVVRVQGKIAAKLSASQWQIGGLAVSTNASTSSLPSGYTPNVGDTVSVFANITNRVSRTSILANTIKLRESSALNNDTLRVAGLVRSIDKAGQRIKVERFEIDTSALSATSPASLVDIGLGDVIRVTGLASNGSVKASSITILRDATQADIEITGVLDDYVPGSRARVRESLLRLDASLVLVGGSSERLGVGTLVKASGKLIDGQVKVTRLELIDTEDVRTTAVHGKVSMLSSSPSSGTSFNLDGVKIQVAPGAILRFSDGTPAPQATLQNGVEITVQGAYSGGKFIASTIILKDSAAPIAKIRGLLTQVDLVNKRGVVDGSPFSWTASTEFDGALTQASLLRYTEVEGRVINGLLTAQKIKVGR